MMPCDCGCLHVGFMKVEHVRNQDVEKLHDVLHCCAMFTFLVSSYCLLTLHGSARFDLPTNEAAPPWPAFVVDLDQSRRVNSLPVGTRTANLYSAWIWHEAGMQQTYMCGWGYLPLLILSNSKWAVNDVSLWNKIQPAFQVCSKWSLNTTHNSQLRWLKNVQNVHTIVLLSSIINI